MRNIIHAPARHNARRLVVAACLALSLGLAGCGGDSETAGSAAKPCGVALDAAAWDRFLDLGSRILAGRDVPAEELEAFALQPTVALWRRGLAPNVPTPFNVANWLDAAFAPNDRQGGRAKDNANRRLLSASYRYSYENRAEVDSLLAAFGATGACRLAGRAAAWIAAENLPAGGLAVSFLPALSEVRFAEDTLLVDTGVLVAGGLDQSVDQMASLLYRNYQAIDGPAPHGLAGAEAVAHVFRVVANEGVADWLARTPYTEFRADHPRLGNVSVIPETFYQTALRVLDLADRVLPGMFADPEVMESAAGTFTGFVTSQNAFGSLGYAMASVIVAHSGEERLREVCRSVPDFVAAYQEAALRNPVPQPVPGAAGSELYQTMRPFPAEAFPGLMDLLRTTFG